jgi:hypothetical protein
MILRCETRRASRAGRTVRTYDRLRDGPRYGGSARPIPSPPCEKHRGGIRRRRGNDSVAAVPKVKSRETVGRRTKWRLNPRSISALVACGLIAVRHDQRLSKVGIEQAALTCAFPVSRPSASTWVTSWLKAVRYRRASSRSLRFAGCCVVFDETSCRQASPLRAAYTTRSYRNRPSGSRTCVESSSD